MVNFTLSHNFALPTRLKYYLVKCNLTQLKEQALCLWALLFSVALRFERCVTSVVPQRCVVFLALFLALCCFPRRLDPYYTPSCSVCIQWLQLLSLGHKQRSAVCPLRAARLQFYCVVSGAFSDWFVWDCIPPLSPPIRSWQLRVVIVLHVCSHVGSLDWPVVFFFHCFSKRSCSLKFLISR